VKTKQGSSRRWSPPCLPKDTLKIKDEQPRRISPCARVISSPRPCSRTLRCNCPDVQVARAEASTKQVASALATCTSGRFQASKG
jgi:hypothetical protein